MIVEQIWTANAYRNFNYLIVCPETGEAMAVDPLDHEKCLAAAKKNGWQITQVLNTHEHGDHTGGNDDVVAATGAIILAHANAKAKIPNMDRGLGAGDVIKIGKAVALECLATPGHTMAHVCMLSRTEQPALFCGAAQRLTTKLLLAAGPDMGDSGLSGRAARPGAADRGGRAGSRVLVMRV